MSKKEVIDALFAMLTTAQDMDPDRLNPERDELLNLLWTKVETYRFNSVQPRCVDVLERALTSDKSLRQLSRSAFPF
jgi:hypothetical protein